MCGGALLLTSVISFPIVRPLTKVRTMIMMMLTYRREDDNDTNDQNDGDDRSDGDDLNDGDDDDDSKNV